MLWAVHCWDGELRWVVGGAAGGSAPFAAHRDQPNSASHSSNTTAKKLLEPRQSASAVKASPTIDQAKQPLRWAPGWP